MAAQTPRVGLVKPPRSASSAPPPETSGEKAFIADAPDANRPSKAGGDKKDRPSRGRKTPISLTLKQDLLDAVDARAEATGQSRAAWISLAIYKALKQED